MGPKEGRFLDLARGNMRGICLITSKPSMKYEACISVWGEVGCS